MLDTCVSFLRPNCSHLLPTVLLRRQKLKRTMPVRQAHSKHLQTSGPLTFHWPKQDKWPRPYQEAGRNTLLWGFGKCGYSSSYLGEWRIRTINSICHTCPQITLRQITAFSVLHKCKEIYLVMSLLWPKPFNAFYFHLNKKLQNNFYILKIISWCDFCISSHFGRLRLIH